MTSNHPRRESTMDSDSDPLSPVELLLEEFLDRQQRGEKPTVGEYCERHPELADEIRHVFEAVAMVEGLKPGSGDVTGKSPSQTRNLAPKILRQVGDYRILREIGRGGMGVVYEAEQESLRRRVALKVLPRSAAGDHKSLLRFQREARAAARMHHTNIVPVFEVGEDDEVVFYAMQLIRGQGLDLVIDDLRNLRSEHIERSDDKHRSAPGSRDRNSTDRAVADGLAASLMTGRFQHENLAGSDADHETPVDSDRPSAKQSVDERPVTSASADPSTPVLEETVAAPSGSSVSATLPGQSEISTAESNRGAYFRSIADIGLQTSRAIGYAHARGIIHRDIKPSNLLLDSTGVVWVTDFGLAKTSDSAMTHTGDILGTIRYMSPERFTGQCDVRTDIYALGLTLYELLTLKPAFASSDRARLMEQVVNSMPPAPRSVDSRIPRDFETIVLKSIDKDPRRRYQSADELEDDLRRFLDDEPILARRISSGERMVRWSRRNPWLSAAVSVAAIALIAVAGLSLLFARQQSIAATEQRGLMAAQARLNQELKESNQRLGDSNQQLEKSKTQREDALKQLQEQHKTLQMSQAHLAYRHGLFELERGATPDGLLWLSRSLELMPDGNRQLFNEVRARLSATADDYPRLQSIVGMPPFRLLDDPGDRPVPGFLRRRMIEIFKEQRLSPDAGYLARLTPINVGFGSPRKRRRLSVWKLASDKVLELTVPSESQGTEALAFSSDSRFLAAVTSVDEKTSSRLVIWNVSSGRLVTDPIETGIQTTGRLPVALRFSPGDEQIVLFAVGSETRSATENRNLGLIGWPFVIGRWDVSTGKLVSQTSSQSFKSSGLNSQPPTFETPFVRSVVISPDTRSSLIFNRAFNSNGLFRIDHQSREIQTLELPRVVDIGRIVPTTSDGRRVAIATKSGNSIGSRVEVWDLESGSRVGDSFAEDDWSISTINVSQDGTQLLVSGRVTNRSEQASYSVAPMQSSEGGRSELTGRVQVWDLASQMPLCPLLMTDQVANAAMLVIDNQAFTIASDTKVKTWQLRPTRLTRKIVPAPRRRHRIPLQLLSELNLRGRQSTTIDGGIGFSDAGELITTSCVGDDVRIQYWDASSARFLREKQINVGENNGVSGVDLENGLLARLNTKPEDQTATMIQCFQVRSGKAVGTPILSQRLAVPLAFDRRGRRLLTVEIPRDPANRRPGFMEMPGSPLSRQVANAGRRATATWRLSVWEVASGKRLGNDCVVGPGVEYGRFVGENKIVFATAKRKIFSWDLQSPRPTSVMTIAGFQELDPARSPTIPRATGGISRDGRWIAVTTDPKTVQVFDLENGNAVGSPMRHPQVVSDVAFDSAGATVAVVMESGLVWQWSTASQWPRDPERIALRLESHLGQRLDERGQRTILDALPNRADDLSIGHEERGHFSRSELQALDSLLSETGATGGGLDAWLSQKPNDSLANFLKMKELVVKQQFDQAQQFLKRSLIQNDQATIGQWLKSEIESTEQVRYRSETHEARDARWTKTQWYLDQSISLLPKDYELKRARVEASFSAGEFQTALAGVLELQELERTEFWHSYLHAILLLRMGRLQDCRNACGELLSEYGQSSDRVSRLHAAQLYLLVAPEGDDFDLAMRLVNQEVEDLIASTSKYKRETHLLVMLTQAIAELRRGNYDLTRETLELRLGEKPHLGDRNGLSSLLYAICELRTGRPLSAGEIAVTAQLQLEKLIDWEGERPGSANGHDLASLSLDQTFGSISTQIQIYRTLFGLIQREIGDGVDLDLAAKCKSVRETAKKHLSQSLAEKAADEIARLIALAPGEPHLVKDFHLLTGSGCGGVSPTRLQQLVISKLPHGIRDMWQSHAIARPNTTDWPVLFEDRFERSEVGTDWTPHDGDWDIEKGQLVGTLNGRAYRSFRSAYVSLNGQCLPTRFEVEYDTWWTDEAVSEVKVFFRDRSSEGFIAGLCGLRHPTRTLDDPDHDTGFGPHLYDSYDDRFHPESKVPGFELQLWQRYRVRVARNEQHVVVYVDDQELMTASIESAFAPVLMLYGFGTPGSTVGFDNLVIRVPPENYVSKAGQGSHQFVDLSEHFNQSLDEGFHGSTNNAGLSGLARGIQKLGGVEFMIGDGCLQLARIPHAPATAHSSDSRIDLHWTGLDSRIDGIQLNKEFDSLHLLHALGWGSVEAPETLVAEIVLHYEDGKTAALPLKIGVHARNWWSGASTLPCSKAVVAWSAENPEAANVNATLYRTTLSNPRPTVVVTKIDYVSSMTGVAPFCVAMTVEK